MSHYIEKVTVSLENLISELARNPSLFLKNPDTDFSRNRKINFKTCVGITMNSGGCTLNKELLDFFDFDVNAPTVSAYTQQRAKILPEAFEYLFHAFTEENAQTKNLYEGYQLLACDGSNLTIAPNLNDPETIKTNLIESYSQLLDFGRKNLPDKFFLEDTVNKSLRNTIVREIISNTLMHREFTSSYTAKFVIEKDRMYVENANRATKEGFITVDNLEPNPKNPLIASFFRNIGYADQLGSGVRKLFKYSKYYSGKDPLFVEDDVFRIIVPLDDAYSFDYGIEAGSSKVIESNNADKMPINADKMPINAGKTLVNSLSAQQNSIIQFAKETGSIKSRQVEELLGVKQRRARRILGELVNMGILERQGAYKSTVYVLKN